MGFNQLADTVLKEMKIAKQSLHYTFSPHSQMLIGRAKKVSKASAALNFQFLDGQQDVLAQVEASTVHKVQCYVIIFRQIIPSG